MHAELENCITKTVLLPPAIAVRTAITLLDGIHVTLKIRKENLVVVHSEVNLTITQIAIRRMKETWNTLSMFLLLRSIKRQKNMYINSKLTVVQE